MSNAAASVAPSRSATAAAADGVCSGWVTVATRTAPTCSGRMPACGDRLAGGRDAHVDDASRPARPSGALSMPERSRIHSSEESMRSQISALVTTRDGR